MPLDLKIEAEETLARMIRKKVTFASEKDDRLTAYLLMRRGLKGKAPPLLCLHQTTAIDKGEPTSGGGRNNLLDQPTGKPGDDLLPSVCEGGKGSYLGSSSSDEDESA